ncbi:hypothetical protein [Sinorhizobium fredii]|uniref:hypothetical protein n=1 Tax=Rhizobium fredii TaxID=380 RepID=UPI0012967DBD|nr:hypothetical protein [Sinorhizobium fredii]MQW94098.1 hypothetical protein [Sinorhizobium fredii]
MTIRQHPPLTFIGPVFADHQPPNPPNYSFLLLQSGADPIKLDYSDKATARRARKQLLTAGLTYPVNSNNLLQAIQHALSLAKQPGQHRDKSPDIPPVEDAAGDASETGLGPH